MCPSSGSVYCTCNFVWCVFHADITINNYIRYLSIICEVFKIPLKQETKNENLQNNNFLQIKTYRILCFDWYFKNFTFCNYICMCPFIVISLEKRTIKIWRSGDRASWRIPTIKPAIISQIYFWKKTLHVSDSSSVHHQDFFTVHTAMLYVIHVCWQLASRIRMELQFSSHPARKLSANLYDIYHCCL